MTIENRWRAHIVVGDSVETILFCVNMQSDIIFAVILRFYEYSESEIVTSSRFAGTLK